MIFYHDVINLDINKSESLSREASTECTRESFKIQPSMLRLMKFEYRFNVETAKRVGAVIREVVNY